MDVTAVNAVLAGASFGAALTTAGIYSPNVIISQLRLENFLMLKTFLTASATSALAIIFAQKLNFTHCKPRTPNSINIFNSYDGNIIGGALLGLGMALTGACPGTVIPQVVAGVKTGPLVLAGGLLGGIIYSKFGKGLQKGNVSKSSATIYEQAGLTRFAGIAIYEIVLLGAVLALNTIYPDSRQLLIPSAFGGFLIGTSQFASLYLTGNTLGISGAFEQLGDVFWYLLDLALHPHASKSAVPVYQNTTAFAIGTAIGSLIIGRLFNIPAPVAIPEVTATRAVLGGSLIVLGARVAGGCTSGHGISGMSQLSIASIFTVMAMFGTGIIASFVL